MSAVATTRQPFNKPACLKCYRKYKKVLNFQTDQALATNR